MDDYVDAATTVPVCGPHSTVPESWPLEVHTASVIKLPKYPADLLDVRHDVMGFISDWVSYCTSSGRAEKYAIADWVTLLGRSVDREIDFQTHKDPAAEMVLKEAAFKNRHPLGEVVRRPNQYPMVHHGLQNYTAPMMKWINEWNVALMQSQRPKKFQISSYLNAMLQTLDREGAYVKRQQDAIVLRMAAEEADRKRAREVVTEKDDTVVTVVYT